MGWKPSLKAKRDSFGTELFGGRECWSPMTGESGECRDPGGADAPDVGPTMA